MIPDISIPTGDIVAGLLKVSWPLILLGFLIGVYFAPQNRKVIGALVGLIGGTLVAFLLILAKGGLSPRVF
jgi:hypothetical protein